MAVNISGVSQGALRTREGGGHAIYANSRWTAGALQGQSAPINLHVMASNKSLFIGWERALSWVRQGLMTRVTPSSQLVNSFF